MCLVFKICSGSIITLLDRAAIGIKCLLSYLIIIFFPNSPEHKGSFINAVDIAVPDSRQEPLTIYAPQSGVVVAGLLTNDRWGTQPEDKIYLNWINIRVDEFEFYEIAHVAPITGKILRVGDKVTMGEPILKTALNGRVTATNGRPDFHVHVLVARWIDETSGKFESLKIRWK